MEDIKERMRRNCRMAGGDAVSVWDASVGEPGARRKRVDKHAQTDAFGARTKRVRTDPLESEVQAAIHGALMKHPAIAWVARINSGAMRTEYKGKRGFYWFNRMPRGLAMSDLIGQKKTGQFFALEVKRLSWNRISDEREECQNAFLTLVRSTGGLGGFVRSVDEALYALNIDSKAL